MFDIGMGWPNADHAIRQVRRVEDFRPYWVEEPLWPDDTAGYRKLAGAVETRIVRDQFVKHDRQRICVVKGRRDGVHRVALRHAISLQRRRLLRRARRPGDAPFS